MNYKLDKIVDAIHDPILTRDYERLKEKIFPSDEVWPLSANTNDEVLSDYNFSKGESSADIKLYRTKSIRSGKILEVEIYPLYNNSKASIRKLVKYDVEVQNRANRRNIRKKLVRLTNANFTSKDIWITVGYRNKPEPSSFDEAKRDVVNYIRRLQRYAAKQSWKKLKYIYVTEQGKKSGKYHHHIIVSFPSREVAESKWTKGEYPQSRGLKPNDYGLEGLARYMSKDASSKEIKNDEDGESYKKKNYGYSLNLIKSWKGRPYTTLSDTKMKKTKANKLAKQEVDAREHFNKLYPGYQYMDITINTSDHVTGWYIYVRMRKKE